MKARMTEFAVQWVPVTQPAKDAAVNAERQRQGNRYFCVERWAKTNNLRKSDLLNIADTVVALYRVPPPKRSAKRNIQLLYCWIGDNLNEFMTCAEGYGEQPSEQVINSPKSPEPVAVQNTDTYKVGDMAAAVLPREATSLISPYPNMLEWGDPIPFSYDPLCDNPDPWLSLVF